MKSLLLVVVLTMSLGASALQAQSRADSLQARLDGAVGPERLTLLADLVAALYNDDPTQALAYGEEAMALLATQPDAATEGRVAYYLGRAHYESNAFEAALASFARALAIYEALDDEAGAARTHSRAGHAHRQLGAYDEALAAHTRALAIREALGDQAGMASTLNNIGGVHRRRAAYDEALSFYTRALTIREERGDQAGIASTLNSLGILHRSRGDYDEALATYTHALTIREERGDQAGIASTLSNIGGIHRRRGAYDEALAFYTRALTIREERGDQAGIASTLNSIGFVHRSRGDYDEALAISTRALTIREDLGNRANIASTLNNIGAIHYDRGAYDEALAFYTRALTIHEAIRNQAGIASVLHGLGSIYQQRGDYDEALAFYTRALAIREERGDQASIASLLHVIGINYRSRGDYDEALATYTRALAINEDLGNRPGTASTLHSIGILYRNQGDYDEALAAFTRALDIRKEIGNHAGIALTLDSIGRVYREQQRLDEALQAANRALALSDSIGHLSQIREAHELRSAILEDLGRHAEALDAYKAYKTAYDSLFTSEGQGIIAEFQEQYRTRQQQQQIELLESQRAQQRLLVLLLLGGVVLAGTIIVLQVGRMRLRRRSLAAIEQAKQATEEKAAELEEKTVELERANALKSRFLANISHEFRTPLTLTFGPLDDAVQGRFASLDDARPHFERAQRNGHRLLRLINQLLDLSKLDAGALLLRPKRQDLAKHLRQLTALFDSIAETQGIDYATRIPDAPLEHVYDADKVEKVVINLLSNAFKFTPKGRKVAVALDREDGGMARIIVADTGAGIAEEHLAHLFDRFYQVEGTTTRTHEGSGIGLALVKELVELHEGTIEVESTVGFGTRFTVLLPRLDVEQVAETVEAEAAETADAAAPGLEALGDGSSPAHDISGSLRIAPIPTPEQPQALPEEATVVLVIEDNADMRQYIRAHLEEHFSVVEADNGQTGVEKALETMPDLVLSDVMMPVMDGLEACAAIKADERTSHIPVVLLTARAQVEHRIEGFESGADAYLPKPFNAEELLVRVRTLIEERRRLRARFARLDPAVPSEARLRDGEADDEPEEAVTAPPLPPREAAFLEQVQTLIAAHFANELFGVDALAEELAMSSRQLLRKLRALTDATPAELLRRQRMIEAARLLEAGTLSVKEVCYAVGFQSNSSFTRAFRETYGVPPSVYAEQARP